MGCSAIDSVAYSPVQELFGLSPGIPQTPQDLYGQEKALLATPLTKKDEDMLT